jgi:flagellar basal body-associated protein FliL
MKTVTVILIILILIIAVIAIGKFSFFGHNTITNLKDSVNEITGKVNATDSPVKAYRTDGPVKANVQETTVKARLTDAPVKAYPTDGPVKVNAIMNKVCDTDSEKECYKVGNN